MQNLVVINQACVDRISNLIEIPLVGWGPGGGMIYVHIKNLSLHSLIWCYILSYVNVIVSAVYGVISWGTTIRFMTCRAALQRFRDFTKLSCAAGPRFRKLFLSWRESRALPLKFVQSRYGLGQHCMCNNVVAHLWFWPSFVTVFVVLMLCVKAHSL